MCKIKKKQNYTFLRIGNGFFTMRSKAKANKEEETNKNYTSKGFVLQEIQF